jgi:hypothetical protein
MNRGPVEFSIGGGDANWERGALFHRLRKPLAGFLETIRCRTVQVLSIEPVANGAKHGEVCPRRTAPSANVSGELAEWSAAGKVAQQETGNRNRGAATGPLCGGLRPIRSWYLRQDWPTGAPESGALIMEHGPSL